MTKENFRENLFIDFNIRISTSCVITSLASIMKQSTSNYVSGISTLSEIKSRLHLHTVSSRYRGYRAFTTSRSFNSPGISWKKHGSFTANSAVFPSPYRAKETVGRTPDSAFLKNSNRIC